MTQSRPPHGHPNVRRDARSATFDASFERAVDAPPIEPEWDHHSEAAPEPVGLPLPRLLSTSDIEAIFGRSARTIRRWVRAGHLAVVRVGGARFFREDDVNQLISGQLLDVVQARAMRGPSPVSSSSPNNQGEDHE